MLEHVRVLELTSGLGDYSGRILAQLGARVTKVMPPGTDRSSLDWLAVNHGKQLRELALGTPVGDAALLEMLHDADILLLGVPPLPGALGADFSARFPALIVVELAAFAKQSPMAGEPVNDLALMALSGIMNIVGEPDGPPLKLPGDQAYALAGIQGVIAALLALNDRASSGQGQRVRVSAYQSAVLAGYRDPIVWEWTGRLGRRTGNRLVRGQSGVRQVWACKDGYVTWSMVDNPGLMKGTVALMAREGAAGVLAGVDWEHTLVADLPQTQIDAWEAPVEAFLLAHTTTELVAMAAEVPIGLSVIATPAMARVEPHWAERGFWRQVHDPVRGLDLQLPGPLFVVQS